MKFAHISDTHLGSWRNPKINEKSMDAFRKAMERCIEEDVDFILLSGDTLDNVTPSIDVLKISVQLLKEARDSGIDIYYIEGSHDFSSTGRTMLKVLESAGLMKKASVASQAEDGKIQLELLDTGHGAKITGVPGRKGALEEGYYKDLDTEHLEKEEGFKIFLFHSGMSEHKPREFEHMEGIPISYLPKGFDYYAGGHVHKKMIFEEEGYGKIAYPGYTFPPGPKEMEKFGTGGFYIVEYDGDIEVSWEPLDVCNIVRLPCGDEDTVNYDADGKTAIEVESEIRNDIKDADFKDSIVMLKIVGTLEEGKESDIDLRGISEKIKGKGAIAVKTNTNKLYTKEFVEINKNIGSKEELENELIDEHVEQFDVEGYSREEKKDLTIDMMNVLSQRKMEDENKDTYEQRVIEETLNTIGLKEELEEVL